MDGFTDYATAVDQMLLKATKVMDPFHVVHLAAEKLQACQLRLQQELLGQTRPEGLSVV